MLLPFVIDFELCFCYATNCEICTRLCEWTKQKKKRTNFHRRKKGCNLQRKTNFKPRSYSNKFLHSVTGVWHFLSKLLLAVKTNKCLNAVIFINRTLDEWASDGLFLCISTLTLKSFRIQLYMQHFIGFAWVRVRTLHIELKFQIKCEKFFFVPLKKSDLDY